MGTGLLWGLLALGGGTLLPASPADSLVGPGEDVPFVAQGPLLCGGAAAAMVERHHGARGVYGEDFLHLVREDEGGIRTSDLVDALRDRGYPTRVSRDAPGAARASLEAGLPPILLLGGGIPALHYVVLVGLEGDRAYLHDPNWGPNRTISVEELHERWSVSGFWMATVLPPSRDTGPTPDPTPPGDGASPPPVVDSAMALLRAGESTAARKAVESLRETGPAAELAWRITATSHYLEGRPLRALGAWNRIGEQRVDLVEIQGLEHTRYHTARRRIDVGHGELVRPGDLRQARRRLAALPSIRASRVTIQPIANGDVELRASVLEHRRWPGPASLALAGGTAVIHERIGLEAGPLLGAGDRWRLEGSWHEAQRRLSFSAAMPAPPVPGILEVALDWRRESHAGVGIEPEERRRGTISLTEWAHPQVRLGAVGSVEQWSDGSRRFSMGGSIQWAGWEDRVWLRTEVEGWRGDDAGFVRHHSTALLRLPEGDHREWRVRAGWASVSSDAPRILWPGAGSGPFREILLRAHFIERNGTLGGPTLAPELAHGGMELRSYRRVGPVRMGGLVFADATLVPARPGAPEERAFVDLGLGLVAGLDDEEAQLTLAHGESGWVLSARLERPIGR